MEFLDSLLTPEEKAASALGVSIIGEMVKARQEKGISQKKLEELSGVKQPVIARMEKGSTSPQLSTIPTPQRVKQYNDLPRLPVGDIRF